MKKIICSLSAIGIVLLMSRCSHSDTPSPITTSANVDAAAAAATHQTSTQQPVATIISSVEDGAVASVTSILMQTLTPRQSTQLQGGQLPAELLLADNPFEQYGILHNKYLNVIFANGGVEKTVNDLVAYDSLVYSKFFNVSAPVLNSDSEKISLYRWFRDNNIAGATKAKAQTITGLASDDKIIEFIGLPFTQTNELKAIFRNFKSMKDNNKSLPEISTYLNSEISKFIKGKKSLSYNEETELIYISVLKHSNYYWN